MGSSRWPLRWVVRGGPSLERWALRDGPLLKIWALRGGLLEVGC